MPYSDPEKMADYMRQYRKRKSDKVNVNHVNPNVNRKPVNPNFRNSQIAGSYEKSLWTGICPVCNFHNTVDPKKSFRPVEKCNHFQQLVIPGTASEFLFLKGNKQSANRKPVNPSVNPSVHPSVNLPKEKYLLSYSRNKYQYVLYSVDQSGRRSLIKSCKKNDKINLGPCEIELTWGPDILEAE